VLRKCNSRCGNTSVLREYVGVSFMQLRGPA
jgi:hypothetical protein